MKEFTIRIEYDWKEIKTELKRIIKGFIKWYLIIIITLNVLFYFLVIHNSTANDLFRQGLLIKAKSYAFIFAHGAQIEQCETINITEQWNETTWYNNTIKACTEYHQTNLYGKQHFTIDLIDELYKQNYTKIWINMCQTGHSKYAYRNSYGYKEEWPAYVNKVEFPANTITIFWGLGFIRIA